MSRLQAGSEHLEHGAAPFRHRRALTALAATVAVLALALVTTGLVRAPDERRALARCGDGAVAAVDRAERRLTAMTGYITPALTNAPTSVEAGLLQLVSDQAVRVRPAVVSALERCREPSFWPVTGAQRRSERDVYVALLEAERDRLAAVAVDGAAIGRGYDEIRRLREQAEAQRPTGN